jgi:FixJ family two-component response regulator
VTENTDSICVCVVEDDEAIRTSLSRLLRASGIDVELFASLSHFNEAPRRAQRSCLLIDLRSLLPREHTMLAEESRKAGSMLPIIAVSDLDDESSRRKSRELGARFLLHKPVDGQALLDAIHWITDPNESTAMKI